MKQYFGEKSQQVDPSAFTAFGIEMESRYGFVDEIIEMMRFAELAARSNVAHYVKRVFYNSKMNDCAIELDPSGSAGDTPLSCWVE